MKSPYKIHRFIYVVAPKLQTNLLQVCKVSCYTKYKIKFVVQYYLFKPVPTFRHIQILHYFGTVAYCKVDRAKGKRNLMIYTVHPLISISIEGESWRGSTYSK